MLGFSEVIPGITNLEHSRYHQGLVYLGLADIHISYVCIYMMILLITSGTFWSTSIGFRCGVSLMITGAGAFPVAMPAGVARPEFLLRAKPFETKMKRRCMTYVFSFLFWIRNVIRYGMIWLIPINHYDCDKKVIMTMIPLIMMGSMTLYTSTNPQWCFFLLSVTYHIAFDLHLWSWWTMVAFCSMNPNRSRERLVLSMVLSKLFIRDGHPKSVADSDRVRSCLKGYLNIRLNGVWFGMFPLS